MHSLLLTACGRACGLWVGHHNNCHFLCSKSIACFLRFCGGAPQPQSRPGVGRIFSAQGRHTSMWTLLQSQGVRNCDKWVNCRDGLWHMFIYMIAVNSSCVSRYEAVIKCPRGHWHCNDVTSLDDREPVSVPLLSSGEQFCPESSETSPAPRACHPVITGDFHHWNDQSSFT